MTTLFEIVVAGHPEAYARQAAAAAFREIDRLEGELSRFIESSDIARANRLRRGESIVIGDDALECLLLAADVALATDGAFDAAYASTRSSAAPDAPVFTLDPATHTLTSHAAELRLDLGAIGKGYALDCAAATLGEWQISAACLHSGGSTVLALGSPPDSPRGWPVGIGDEASAQTLLLAAASLSGSGTAVKGAHLIDPRRAQPAARQGRTWALAATAAQTDALSTAFFAMSDEEVAAFCTTYPHIGVAISRPPDQLLLHGALTALLG